MGVSGRFKRFMADRDRAVGPAVAGAAFAGAGVGGVLGRGLALAGLGVLSLGAALPDRPARAQGAALPDEIVMQGERLFPESIAADAAGNLYVSSNPGIVFRAEAGEGVARPWIRPDAQNGLGSVFGVLADDARSLLWLCSNPRSGGPASGPAIKAFALDDGRLVGSYPLGTGEGPAMCNDITIAPNGDVYASEMLGGRILRLRPGETSFSVWASDPEFATLDGISFGPGGELYANAIQRNTLLHIHRHPDGSFARARVLPTSRPLDAPDGLRPLDDRRMLQSEGNGGVITVLTFAPGQPVAVEVIAQGIDYASAVTSWRGRAFFPEGKLGYLFDPALRDADPGRFVIRSVPIPAAR